MSTIIIWKGCSCVLNMKDTEVTMVIKPMQKWEYLQILCEEGRPRYVNGQEIPNWQQGPTFWEALRHLFRKGWELVDDPLAPTSDLRIAYQQWLDYHWEEIPHHFRRLKN